MAPDLNSVPASPRELAETQPLNQSSSRRSSRIMAPPSVPVAGSSGFTGQTIVPGSTLGSAAAGDNTGVGSGPGPMRHPRPLTAADLHLQLEKEQEAVVSLRKTYSFYFMVNARTTR